MIHLTPSHMALREKAIATFVILAVTSISVAFYDHRKSTYSAGKTVELGSVRVFSYLYRYIQLSTIASALGGCLFFDRVFLDIHDSTAAFYCGLVITVTGIVLFASAKLSLAENYSPCFDAFLPNSITTAGPYRYIRHPIYMSNILILIGAFVMSGSLWILLSVGLAAYFYTTSAIREETELCQHIPIYLEYQNSTGRFLPKLF